MKGNLLHLMIFFRKFERKKTLWRARLEAVVNLWVSWVTWVALTATCGAGYEGRLAPHAADTRNANRYYFLNFVPPRMLDNYCSLPLSSWTLRPLAPLFPTHSGGCCSSKVSWIIPVIAWQGVGTHPSDINEIFVWPFKVTFMREQIGSEYESSSQ